MLDGLSERAGERFEDALRDVVAIPPVEDFHVEIGPQIRREGAAKFLDQTEGEVLSRRSVHIRAKLQPGTIAEVDDDTGERFVHGDIGKPVAGDPDLVAQRFFDAFPEHDARILNSVVEINLHIADDFEVQIARRVPREEGQHVIEEGDAGIDRGAPFAIEIDREGDVRFCGFSRLARLTWVGGHGWLGWRKGLGVFFLLFLASEGHDQGDDDHDADDREQDGAKHAAGFFLVRRAR